ncbi:MAG: putative sugar nucleotidyl transferase [Candidatus Riflemargulisbacteria bacterium]
MKNIVIYEDISEPWFSPLDQLRAVFEIKAGMFSFLERIFLLYPESRHHLFYRDNLKGVVRKRYPAFFHNTLNVGLDVLFINGRVVVDNKLKNEISNIEEEFLLLNGDKVICFRLKGNKVASFVEEGIKQKFSDKYVLNYFRQTQGYIIKNIVAKRFENIWQIISDNGEMIRLDFEIVDKGGLVLSRVETHTALTNEKDIYIGKHSTISPFVHIDATKGPVYIGRGVEIKSNVLIEGPVFIDNGAKIYPGYIRENTSIGENCRVGGEVEGSIFLANSNKYHAGFVGHSYVGEWVNFGAMATTSDLKNNYKEIILDLGEEEVASGTRLIGSIIGDHCKFGIGTMINSGTIFGVAVNVVGSNFKLPKRVSAFSWIVDGSRDVFLFDKFIETAKVVVSRRNKELSPEEISLFEQLYSKLRLVIKKN